MNKNIVRIYALIMLECRLSLEDASRIFNVDINRLKEELNIKNLKSELFDAIEYLLYEITCYPLDNKRGIFKANIYIRRLRYILKNPNKKQLKDDLNDLVNDLKGPDISFVLKKEQSCRYSKEEKEKILKYRLKFRKTGTALRYMHIDKSNILNWENELSEGDLKTRLQILRNYLNMQYVGVRKK